VENEARADTALSLPEQSHNSYQKGDQDTPISKQNVAMLWPGMKMTCVRKNRNKMHAPEMSHNFATEMSHNFATEISHNFAQASVA